MTIATSDNRLIASGNAVATAFTGPKLISASQASWLKVYLIAAGVATLQTTDKYVVTGFGRASTIVTFVTPPPSATNNVLILRIVPDTQETRFTNQGRFFPEVHENAFDVNAMRSQQHTDHFNRSLHFPDSVPATAIGEISGTLTPGGPLVISPTGDGILVGSTTLTGDMALRPALAASGGSAIVGFLQTGTGAVARTAQNKMRDRIAVEDYGAVGDGTTDDTAAFSLAAATGKIIMLKSSSSYLISSGISMVGGGGFVCENGKATIACKAGTGGFAVASGAAPRDGADKCVFRCIGIDGVQLEGLRFVVSGATETAIYPIRVSGGMSTKPAVIRDIEMIGFKGAGGGLVGINSVGAGAYVVENVAASTCGTALGIAYWGAFYQMTVVEVDADLVGGVHSQPGVMRNIRGTNILVSGTALTDYGQQTDVLTLAGISGTDRKGPLVVGVFGDGVGEVVDMFCSHAIVKGVRVRNCVYGVKFAHGAQYNDVELETVESALAACMMQGSDTTAYNTQYNNVRIGTAKGIGTGLPSPISGSEACVLFINGTTAHPKNNTVRVDNCIGDGVNMKYVVRHGGGDVTGNNFVEVLRASGWATTAVSCDPNNVSVRFRDSTRVKLTMSATQAVTNGVAATIAYNTAAIDKQSEANLGTYKVRPKTPGPKLITASIRMSPIGAATDPITISILKNGSAIATATRSMGMTTDNPTFSVSCINYCAENECGLAASDLYAQVTTSGGNTPVMNAVTMSFFEVTDLG